MNILIVEDNENKLSRIRLFMEERYNDCFIDEAHSFSSGRRKVFDPKWDLIILDMSLPAYDITHTESGGDKKPIAGKNIIKRMKNREVFIPTVVITQFETFDDEKISLTSLNQEFEQSYQDIWKGTIYYGNDDWENELSLLLDRINL
jgi:DNA-binding NarL/FixJ family response regulator